MATSPPILERERKLVESTEQSEKMNFTHAEEDNRTTSKLQIETAGSYEHGYWFRPPKIR